MVEKRLDGECVDDDFRLSIDSICFRQAHAHDTEQQRATPPYLQLLDVWYAKLSCASTISTKNSLQTVLVTLTQNVNQLHDRERTSLSYFRDVKTAAKKAAKAGRALAKTQSRVAPESVSPTSQGYSNVPLSKRRRLSRKLHTLDTARHKLHVSSRDNEEFVRNMLWKAQTDVWLCAEGVSRALEGIYLTVRKEGLAGAGLPSYEDLLDPAPPNDPLNRTQVGGGLSAAGRRASKWRVPEKGNDAESVVIFNPLSMADGGHAQGPSILGKDERGLQYANTIPRVDISSPSESNYLGSSIPPQSPIGTPVSTYVANPTAPPASHLAETPISTSKITSHQRLPSQRAPPPPPPFVPGYIPDTPALAEPIIAVKPRPPPIPPRPAHVRKRPPIKPRSKQSAIDVERSEVPGTYTAEQQRPTSRRGNKEAGRRENAIPAC